MYVLVLFVIFFTTVLPRYFQTDLEFLIHTTELIKRKQRQRQGRLTKAKKYYMEKALEKFRRCLKNIPNTKQDMSLIGDVKF